MAVVVPAAPILFELTPGDESIIIKTFFLEAESPFTDVLYSTNGKPYLSLGATSGPVTITKESDGTTDFTNGRFYIITLVGVSTEYPLDSSTQPSASLGVEVNATPQPPSPPRITSFTRIDGAFIINYILGDNGGSVVTSVKYTTDGGATWASLPGSLDGTSTITTESNGVTPIGNEKEDYFITIAAVTSTAPNPEDNPQSFPPLNIPAFQPTSTPATPPFINQITAGNNQLTAYYNLGNDGGSNYDSVWYSTDDGKNWLDSYSTNGTAQIFYQTGVDPLTPLVNGVVYDVRLLVTTDDFPDVDPSINVPSNRVSAAPESGTVPPSAPSIGYWSPGDGSLNVFYTINNPGTGVLENVYYSTNGGADWQPTNTTNGTCLISTLSTNGTTPLTNGTQYLVQLVAVTSDFGNHLVNTPSSAVPMVPSTGITRPSVVNIDNIGIFTATTSIGVTYSIQSTGGSPLSDIWYSTDGSASWRTSGAVNGQYFSVAEQSDGYPLETNKNYNLLLVAGTQEYPDYQNNPIPGSATPFNIPLVNTSNPPSAPIIGSTSVGDKTFTIEYNIPSDGGSAVTDVLYTTDGGNTWFTTGETFPFGNAVISALSTDGSTLLSNGTEYYVQLMAITVDFQPISNPSSIIQYITPQATPVGPKPPLIELSSVDKDTFVINYVIGDSGSGAVLDIQYTTDGGSNWLSTGNTSGQAIISSDSAGNPLVINQPYIINLVTLTVGFDTPSIDNASVNINLTIPPTQETVPPNAPRIEGHSPGDGSVEVFFTLDSAGSGILTGILYTTNTGVNPTWVDTGVVSGSFLIQNDSNGNPLVNGQEYNVRIVAITSPDYLNPAFNTPSEPNPMTPLASPLAPTPPAITGYTPGDTTLTVRYTLGSDGGSFYTSLWYSTNNGDDWQVLDVFSSIPTSTYGLISAKSDGSGPLVNGDTYRVRLMATTDAFPTPVNDASDYVDMTPSDVAVRPSAPVITSWNGIDGALIVRYTIPFDGGSSVTAVYYSTDGGLSWDPTTSPNGTAVIRMTSGGSGPIVNSTTYSVRLVIITIAFPSLSNPSSNTVYMTARPTLPGTFKPKGMSYTEFLRSKKAVCAKIINTKPVRTASEITNARRLAASNVFALNNEAVKGSITTPIDFSQGGLHAARSYFKQGGAGRRVGSASEFTAFSGSQAIGGLAQAGLPPTRLLQQSNFILVSAPVAQGVSDSLRRDQGCKKSLGEQHNLAEVTPPKFVDNTIRNTGSPACVTRPAIHEIKAKNAFAYVPNRPSQAEGQYALKGDLEPGKELGGYGGKLPTHLKINKPITTLCSRTGANPNYKAGAALDNIPYVEKHHGNDLNVNPKRPFVKYQIPEGTPPHLKINRPKTTGGYVRPLPIPFLEDPDLSGNVFGSSGTITAFNERGTSFQWYNGQTNDELTDGAGSSQGPMLTISGSQTDTITISVDDWFAYVTFTLYCVVTNEYGSVTTTTAQFNK